MLSVGAIYIYILLGAGVGTVSINCIRVVVAGVDRLLGREWMMLYACDLNIVRVVKY